jgi:5-methylcytosine-specific restriction endonuclease McrA
MMKTWNKKFYQSRAWQECRESYLQKQQFICERCGEIAKIAHHKTKLTPENIHDPYISLAYENLEALCQTCHNTEHHASPKVRRYAFCAAGEIIYPPHSESRTERPQTETAP